MVDSTHVVVKKAGATSEPLQSLSETPEEAPGGPESSTPISERRNAPAPTERCIIREMRGEMMSLLLNRWRRHPACEFPVCR